MNLDEFIKKMEEIKEKGYIQSHRRGDTGIGKTLEDLLGIQENNISRPDFGTYELKSGRKDSVSMLTLFTKTPQPRGAIAILLDAYGYPRRDRDQGYSRSRLDGIGIERENTVELRDKELHVTLDSIRFNSVGLMIKMTEDKLIILNDQNIKAQWDKELLRRTFESKYHNMIYVLADNRKDGGVEFFWFDEAYLLDGFSFDQFSSLIERGLIKIDLRVGHYSNGSIHDHGTAFRIMPRHLPECFQKIHQII